MQFRLMKMIGCVISIMGVLIFLASISFQQTLESNATLCQIVEGKQLVGRPVRLLLPPNQTFVKGTGPLGSRFIEKSFGPFRSIEAMAQLFALAKIGGLIIVGLGIVGFQFENWRQKTGAILTGRPPDL